MEKICGGGVPRKAIDLLDKIGIDTKLFLSKDVSIINGHVVEQNGMTKRVYYSKEKFALGMKRRILDGYILEQALLKGCKIDFGINVSKIIYRDSLYKIMDIWAEILFVLLELEVLEITFLKDKVWEFLLKFMVDVF